jgi:DNA-binding XRE family transcriptional regulator
VKAELQTCVVRPDAATAKQRLAFVTSDAALLESIAAALSVETELVGFRTPADLPRDTYFDAYILDLRTGRLSDWAYPLVEVPHHRESTYYLLASTVADVDALGMLPPRCLVIEWGSTAVARLVESLESLRADRLDAGRMLSVRYLGSAELLVFEFCNGRHYVVALEQLTEADRSPLTSVCLGADAYSAIIHQESGNRFDVPWDLVMHMAEPSYPYFRGDVRDDDTHGLASRVSARIRSERTQRGWSQADLAARTGIAKPNVARLESGRHSPSLETLERVADAFGIPVAALVARHHVSAGPPAKLHP